MKQIEVVIDVKDNPECFLWPSRYAAIASHKYWIALPLS